MLTRTRTRRAATRRAPARGVARGLARRAWMRAVAALFVLGMAGGGAAVPAHATGNDGDQGRVALDDGVFTVAVFGDSLADGLWASIYRRLQRDERFEVLRATKAATGITRPDYYDWSVALSEHLADNAIDAAVFSIGLNDMQAMVVDDSRAVEFRSETWDRLYRERVGGLMDQLEQAGIPTFWIGQPIMRSDRYSANISHVNDLIRAETEPRDIPFVELWPVAADENGDYASYLADADGRSRLIRANDGIHFTSRGYDLLARHVLDVMRTRLGVFRTQAAEGGGTL
ncbi:MAG: DUF459 domain-containing protein [Azospirillaceae bacterium]